jgi:hypothetical protein
MRRVQNLREMRHTSAIDKTLRHMAFPMDPSCRQQIGSTDPPKPARHVVPALPFVILSTAIMGTIVPCSLAVDFNRGAGSVDFTCRIGPMFDFTSKYRRTGSGQTNPRSKCLSVSAASRWSVALDVRNVPSVRMIRSGKMHIRDCNKLSAGSQAECA